MRAQESQNWWIYFLSEMRKVKNDVYLVGEVWAPAAQVAPYLKGIPALFNFDLASNLKKVSRTGISDSIVFKLKSIEDFYKTINPAFVDATFLSNHDQERLMSTLDNDHGKAEIAAALLLTLPGSPYLYYGEEIGMMGKKPDEFIREPFLWDKLKNDLGRTSWMKPKYNTDSTIMAANEQLKDKKSLLNFYKSFIKLRNLSQALTFGNLIPCDLNMLNNTQLCAFVRSSEDENLLVMHNLSDKELNVLIPKEYQGFNKVYFKNKSASLKNTNIHLSAYSTLILQK
jgi:glycosidase